MSDVTLIATTASMLEAEIIRGLLKANGIESWLSSESAGTALGASGFGPLAEIEILVSSRDENQARGLMDDYRAGKLQT